MRVVPVADRLRACAGAAGWPAVLQRPPTQRLIRLNNRWSIPAALAHPAVMRAAPFAIFIAFLAVFPVVPEIAPEGIAWDLRWMQLLRAVSVIAALAWFWHSYGELGAPAGVDPRYWLLAIASGLAVFGVWIHFDEGWAVIGRAGGFDPTGADGRIDPALAGLRLAESALVVPVMEELFWRSFLLRWLDSRNFLAADPRRASPTAFLLSAGLFASEHALWFAGLLAGLVYNGLYVRTGKLWVVIAAHSITNGALGVWVLATRSWHLW